MRDLHDRLIGFLDGRLVSAAIEIAGPGGRLDRVGRDDAPFVGRLCYDRGRILPRMMANPGLEVGEAYVAGEWRVESGDLAQIIAALRRDIVPDVSSWLQAIGYGAYVARHFIAQFAPRRASSRNVEHHYDIGNTFYRLWLDDELHYSCAYYHDPGDTLEQAQANKARHIAAKLNLSPGDHVLDIGCGWGAMAFHLARHCGVRVTGISLSAEQVRFAAGRAAALGLGRRTRFALRDYRDVEGPFDAVVSVGMLEHVGRHRLPRFFAAVHNLLRPDGVALVHTIGSAHGHYVSNQWMDRYIFPGGYIPSLRQLAAAIETTSLVTCDIETLRDHYAPTLRAWRRRLHAAKREVIAMFDARFFRIWDFYLAVSEASFLAGVNVNYQLQLAHHVDALPRTRDYLYTRDARETFGVRGENSRQPALLKPRSTGGANVREHRSISRLSAER